MSIFLRAEAGCSGSSRQRLLRISRTRSCGRFCILIGSRSPLRDVLCATALSFAAESAVPRLAGRCGRLQEKPNRCLVLTPIADVVCSGEEIFIAVLNPDLSLFIDRNQTTHLIVDAQKLVAFHVSILRV